MAYNTVLCYNDNGFFQRLVLPLYQRLNQDVNSPLIEPILITLNTKTGEMTIEPVQNQLRRGDPVDRNSPVRDRIVARFKELYEKAAVVFETPYKLTLNLNDDLEDDDSDVTPLNIDDFSITVSSR